MLLLYRAYTPVFQNKNGMTNSYSVNSIVYPFGQHGEWREKYPNSSDIPELDGAVAGLVGLGTIGHLVAQKLSCFNCGILVYDPYTPKEKIEGCGYRYAESLNSLLEQADYVSLHARVTDETRGMMGDDEFKRMKSSAVLINTARPALVDTGALCRALENNIIRGAAVDVFDQEPVDPDNPLLKLDNITLTNHRGGDTTNSYKKSPGMLYRELERYYAGETPRFFIPALQEANQWSY